MWEIKIYLITYSQSIIEMKDLVSRKDEKKEEKQLDLPTSTASSNRELQTTSNRFTFWIENFWKTKKKKILFKPEKSVMFRLVKDEEWKQNSHQNVMNDISDICVCAYAITWV